MTEKWIKSCLICMCNKKMWHKLYHCGTFYYIFFNSLCWIREWGSRTEEINMKPMKIVIVLQIIWKSSGVKGWELFRKFSKAHGKLSLKLYRNFLSFHFLCSPSFSTHSNKKIHSAIKILYRLASTFLSLVCMLSFLL